MRVFAGLIKHSLNVSVQRPQHADAFMHREIVAFGGVDQAASSHGAFRSVLLAVRLEDKRRVKRSTRNHTVGRRFDRLGVDEAHARIGGDLFAGIGEHLARGCAILDEEACEAAAGSQSIIQSPPWPLAEVTRP